MIDSILFVVSLVIFSGNFIAISKSRCSARREFIGLFLPVISPYKIQGFSPAISFSIFSISLNLS